MTIQTQGHETLEQIRAFLDRSQALDIKIPQREATYVTMGERRKPTPTSFIGRLYPALVKISRKLNNLLVKYQPNNQGLRYQ